MDNLKVLPLHKFPKFIKECCALINDEWKRSETARLRSLEASCDSLPTSLILIKNEKCIGHVKLSAIPSIKEAVFVESVVIDKQLRGQGYGRVLMKKTEEYCEKCNFMTIYLSTRGQEEFYRKLGYVECAPVSIYGCAPVKKQNSSEVINYRINEKMNNLLISGKKDNVSKLGTPPPPPPMPVNKFVNNGKTFMKKDLNCT